MDITQFQVPEGEAERLVQKWSKDVLKARSESLERLLILRVAGAKLRLVETYGSNSVTYRYEVEE